MEVFDSEAIEEIGKISRLSASQLAALATRLETIGKDFRAVILSVPTNMRLGPQDKPSSVRQKWLREELQPPLDRVLNAIEQRSMLSSLPDCIPSEPSDDEWSQLRNLLGRLRQFSEDLGDSLEARTADSSTINAELRFDLVSKLAEACKEAGLPASRHRYPESGYVSPTPRIIEVACRAICGATFPIDPYLRDYLKLCQAK
jgi:hypothetical protein